MQRQVLFIAAITSAQGSVKRSQDQRYLTGVKRAKEVGILTVTGLRQAHGL